MHADELALTPTPGVAPASADPAPTPSPWEEVRAECPDKILVRVINTTLRLQFWIALPRTGKNLACALVYDGATVVDCPRGPRDDAERASVIAEYDTSWQRQKQCHSKFPTTGSRA